MRQLIFLAFVFAALLLTWPLATQVATHVPLGSEPAATVPYFNVWTVGWNGIRARNGFRGYWDAPIFYPATGSFAFSDPQPLTATAGAVAWDQSPALAYNLLLLSYLTLNGGVTYALLRQRGATVGPAVLGGLLAQWLPYATNERGVLQLQALFGPIWAIGALWALLARPSRSLAVSLGLAVGVTFLTSEYYALLLAPALLASLALHVPQLRQAASWRSLVTAGAVASTLILPVALPQAAILRAHGFQRSESSFARSSAWPADYLRPSSRLRLHAALPEFGLPSNQRLYPGMMLVGLAAVGVVTAIRGEARSRRWVSYLLTIATIGFALSLGSHLRLESFAPLTRIHQTLPLLRLTRSPFRFAALAQIALALLASAGITWLWTRSRWLAIAIAAVSLLELAPLPERLAEVPDTDAEWTTAVARGEQSVVAHLPWAVDRSASQFAATTRWMIEALPYELPLVNGYSGFFPGHHTELRELMANFPSDEAIRALRDLGVDFIVLHGEMESEQRGRIDQLVEEGVFADQVNLRYVSVLRMPGDD